LTPARRLIPPALAAAPAALVGLAPDGIRALFNRDMPADRPERWA
jgi:hypothetical protein